MSDMDQPVNTWCGHPRYACPFCAFDTLEAENFREHIQMMHPTYEAKPAKPPVPMTVTRKPPAKPAKE